MYRRSAADGVAASKTVRRTRVGIVEGVLRLSAVETEQKEGMRVFFLVMNFADSNFEFADLPYSLVTPRLTPAARCRLRGSDGQYFVKNTAQGMKASFLVEAKE